MSTLTDPAGLVVPARSPIQPAAPLDRPVEPTPPSSAERAFDLQSPNGYLRTVVGTIAYLDREANTYMVRSRTGELVRVPLRGIRDEVEG
jgi:hypothetical protein